MDFDSMTEKEAFKAGFMAYCKEAGWSDAQISDRIKVASDPTWGMFARELVRAMNPFGKSGPKGTNYLDTVDKWYNPWTKNTDPMSKGESTLMRVGQGATALGTAAGAAIPFVPGGIAAGGAAALNMLGGVGRGILGFGAGAGSRIRGVGAMLGRGLSLGTAATLGGAAMGAGANIAQLPRALGDRATDPATYGNLGMLMLGAPIAGGLALGGGLGYGAAKITEPKLNEDDLKAQEIEQAYKIQAKRLKARREYEQYRRARGESN